MLTEVLFLDKLCVKCESFKAIELEMPMLLEFLERRRARHLFRSSHLNRRCCLSTKALDFDALQRGDVAALARSHMNGSLPFEKTIEQTI